VLVGGYEVVNNRLHGANSLDNRLTLEVIVQSIKAKEGFRLAFASRSAHSVIGDDKGLDITRWLELLKQYGPLLGLLLGFIVWQAHQINRLLDRNSSIYEGEIKRLAEVQNRLLAHILGPQPSSTESPTIKQLEEGAKRLENQKNADKKGGD
jgi:hypothetical protein